MAEDGWLFLPSSGEPLYIRRNSNIMQLRQAQTRRAAALTGLCKALLPIMESILYYQPIISSMAQFQNFIQRASAPRPVGRPRGFWTTCFVYDPAEQTRALQELDENFSIEDLYQLSIHCPRIHHMEIRDLQGQLGDPHSFADLIMFPQLRCLIFPQVYHQDIPSTTREHLNIEHASMPNLQYLHITPKDVLVQSYIEQFGRTLTTLELSSVSNLKWVHRPTRFPQNLFQLCPQLKTFGFPFEDLKPLTNSALFNAPFQPLNSLVLCANSRALRRIPQRLMLQLHFLFFNPSNFPNIKSIAVVLYDSRQDQAIRQVVQSTFPNASLNTRTVNM